MPFLTIEKYNTRFDKGNTWKKIVMAFVLLVVPMVLVVAWAITSGFLTDQFFLAQAATGINQQINYQGKIADNTGTAIADGDYGFIFEFYDDVTGGNNLWEETWTATTTAGAVSVSDGVFSVGLGISTSLSSVDFNDDTIYVQVYFDADGDGNFEERFSPRKRITATPYAFNTDTVDGFHATDSATAGQLLALDDNAGMTVNAVTTTDSLYVSSSITLGGVSRNTWPEGGSGSNLFNQWLDTTSTVEFAELSVATTTFFGEIQIASTTGQSYISTVSGDPLAVLSPVSFFTSGYGDGDLNGIINLYRNVDEDEYGFHMYSAEDNTHLFTTVDSDFNVVTSTLVSQGDLTATGDLQVSGIASVNSSNTHTSLNVGGGIWAGSLNNWDGGSLGGGTRMMWIPASGSFRAGQVVGTQWDSANIGDYSVAFGSNSIASGNGSFTAGTNSQALGTGSFAFGSNVTADGFYAVAFGINGGSYGVSSFSSGNTAIASSSSLAIGDFSHAIGQSIALGLNAKATSGSDIAIGVGTEAYGGNSMAIGSGSIASGEGALAIGKNILASGDYSIGIGNGVEVSNDSIVGIGTNINSSGIGSIAIGTNNTTTGDFSAIVGGIDNEITGDYSYTLGSGVIISAENSIGFNLFHTNPLEITKNNTMVIMGGSVGINTTTPSHTFQVQGDLRVTGNDIQLDALASGSGTDYVCINASGDLSSGSSCTTIELINEYPPQQLSSGQIQILDIVKLYYPEDHENELVAGKLKEYYYKIAFDVNGVTRVGRIHVTKTIEEAEDVLGALSAYVREFLRKDVYQYEYIHDYSSSLYGQIFDIDLGVDSNISTPNWLNPRVTNVLPDSSDSNLLGNNISSNLTDQFFIIEQSGNLSGNLLQVSDIANNKLMTVKTSGNVGVGTETPESRLVVSGGSGVLTSNSTSTKAGVIIKDESETADHTVGLMLMKDFQDSTSADRSISMVFGSDGYGYNSQYYFGRIAGGRQSSAGGEGYLSFHAGKDGAGEMADMTITYNGNIGIGINNPDYRLQVAGDIVSSAKHKFNLGHRTMAWNNIYYNDLVSQNIESFYETSVLDKMLEYPPQENVSDNYYLDNTSLPEELSEFYVMRRQYDQNTNSLWVKQNIKIIDKAGIEVDMTTDEIREYIDDYKNNNEDPRNLEDTEWGVATKNMTAWNYKAIHELLNFVGYSIEEEATSTLEVIDQPELEIDTLVVKEVAEFSGTLLVNGESVFKDSVTFESNINVYGKIYVDEDQAGTVEIKSGWSFVEVVFDSPYEYVPKISVTPQSRLWGKEFWVSDKTTSSFKIITSGALNVDTDFDWIALANKIEMTSNYNTTTESIINVDDSEEIATSTEETIDELEFVLGCTDETATNYDSNATKDDGSCEYPYLGCMDESAINYNPEATEDDGSCILSVLGCMDSTASNYSIEATEDDGSCEYIILGCMDESAINYNPEATEDDGSCTFSAPTEDMIEGEVLGAQEVAILATNSKLVKYLIVVIFTMIVILSWLTIKELRRNRQNKKNS